MRQHSESRSGEFGPLISSLVEIVLSVSADTGFQRATFNVHRVVQFSPVLLDPNVAVVNLVKQIPDRKIVVVKPPCSVGFNVHQTFPHFQYSSASSYCN